MRNEGDNCGSNACIEGDICEGMQAGNEGLANNDGGALDRYARQQAGVSGACGVLYTGRSKRGNNADCMVDADGTGADGSERSCGDIHIAVDGNRFSVRELPRTKTPIGISVLHAAQLRIAQAFDNFERIYVSFSAGKDSTVMLHLVCEEARKRGRAVGVLLVDLEAQYKLTIAHGEAIREMYADCTEWFWVCLPIHLRNAVSMYQSQWVCWDEYAKDQWVRNPPKDAITDKSFFPFFVKSMEFEEFVPEFGEWYAQGKPTACFVGIRTDESLNRFRTIASITKARWSGLGYTTMVSEHVANFYPVYDWRTEDLWTWHARNPGKPHNPLYDMMHKAGLTIHQMRICQPYGDDQKKGLWLYHIIEPETWGRVVARVSGANSGAMYVRETGNITGARSVTLPEGHTWRSFAELLLATLPTQTSVHFRAKIDVFRKWWMDRGYSDGIPDEADAALEAKRKVPSWRRVCKSILRNDYWCKGLGFSQHRTGSYDRYLSMMDKRRKKKEWNVDQREDERMPLFEPKLRHGELL
jgi:predicted phosphoadenosine phosphosulfate sulfurtransferase